MGPSTQRDESHEEVDYIPLAVDPAHVDDANSKAGPEPESDEVVLVNPRGESMTDTVGFAVAYVFGFTFIMCTWVILFTNHPFTLGWFFWHPFLLSVAVVAHTYGILTLQPTSHAQPSVKAAGRSRHQLYMFALGFPAAALGIVAVSYNKYLHHAAHFATWHGRFGIATLTWMLVQIAVGGGSVWANGKLFGGNPRARRVWKYHRLSGYVLFVLLLVTAHLGGTWSDFAQNNVVPIVRLLAYTIAPILLLGGVFARVRLSKMRFFNRFA
ncbi:hypothetical protein BKA93DRAFT_760707 [Sparassis latifolia]|uniref:Cytochrome b561 domain-containing protein n=1 Tax=Sparassis crispa TaxID=139825 RepID=A0A401GJP4_9APHY|nr:hypothetical protein SCP_0407640 [Sparassis crispa]GBE82380.1 hypothetical protein SCP_0407640 [Sparassis crispa]